MARILVADDHDLVRETIAAYLEAEWLGTVLLASHVDQALRMLAERAGVELPDRQRADPTVRERKDRLAEILESTALFYRGLPAAGRL